MLHAGMFLTPPDILIEYDIPMQHESFFDPWMEERDPP